MTIVEAAVSRLRKRLDGQTKVLVKNSSWVFFANAYRALLAFAKSVLIAHGLGADLYGNYVLIFALVSTTRQFFDLNMGTAVIKFGADYRSEGRDDKLVALIKASIYACALLAVLSIVVVFGVSEVAYGTLIGVPGLEIYVLLFAAAASVAFFESVSTGLLRLYYKFRLNSIVQMSTASIDAAAMAIVLFAFPRQIEPFLIAMIGATFIDGIIVVGAGFWEMRKGLKRYLRVPVSLISQDWKVIRGFVVSNSASRTLGTFIERGDVLLLGALSTSAQVGLYDIAKKLAYTILRFTDPLTKSIYPQIASLIAQRRLEEVRRLLTKVTLAFAAPTLPVLIVAFATSDWLMTNLYGKDFAGSGSTFFVHLITASLSAALFWALPLIQSLNMVAIRLKVTVFALVSGGIVGYFVAPAYGAAGIAVVSMASKSMIVLDMVRSSNKRLRSMKLNGNVSI